MDRRRFLAAGIAGTSLLGLGSVWSQASPNYGLPQLPANGVRRVKVGAVEVIALNDGAVRRPLGDEFVRNAPLEQVKALLASQGLPTDYVDVPYTPFLIVSGNTRFLVDTGFADNGPPTTGRLRANLAAAGFQPQDIQHVLVSHYHGDHINGLRGKDGSLVFPNAKVHVPAPEHAFWMDEIRASEAPAAMRGAFENVRRVIGGLPKEQVATFEPGQELVPGLITAPAYGHTPGMSTFTVRSQGESFTYLADLTNIPSLFARSPDWAVVFDMNPEMARLTRRRVFEQVARERSLVGGFHFPFPAIGRMEPSGGGWQFRPVA